MSQLIRFEDKYGMGDIVSLAQDLGDVNHNIIQLSTKTNKSNVWIQIGLSIGAVFSLDDLFKSNINKDVDEIIFVYDMDTISGKGVLTPQELQKKLSQHGKFSKKYKLRYTPIVWCAETVALYVLLDVFDPNNTVKGKCVDITTLVHQKNTAKFHDAILAKVLRHENINNVKVKHMTEYIKSKDVLVNKISQIIKNYPNGINMRTLQWIITGNTDYLYGINEVINHQNDVVQLHQNYLPSNGETFKCYSEELSLDKKCW